MKKFLVSALAVVALASCSQNEIMVDSGKPTPIHFKPQFGNSVISRADQTLGQNIALGVYAYNGISPTIYDNISNLPLAYDTDGWYLTPKEHYYPQDDSDVSFWAYGPHDHSKLNSSTGCDATNGPSFTLTLANTDTDVDIIATQSVITGKKSTAGNAISFALKHVLAQVKFEAKVNTQANAQAFDVKIYSVTIKTKGEASYASSSWGTSHTGGDVIWTVIGAEEATALTENVSTLGSSVNVIPEQAAEIEVKAKVYKKNENVVIADQTATLTLDGSGGGAFLAQGTCYTYTISVTPNVGQIVFGDPTLTPFAPASGDVSVTQ